MQQMSHRRDATTAVAVLAPTMVLKAQRIVSESQTQMPQTEALLVDCGLWSSGRRQKASKRRVLKVI